MNGQSKELNRLINRMYRQLGKDVFDDLKKNKVNIRKYKGQSKRIENVIKALRELEISMDNLEGNLGIETPLPKQDEAGLFHYKFCPSCNAGNNPEATHCMRCELKLG